MRLVPSLLVIFIKAFWRHYTHVVFTRHHLTYLTPCLFRIKLRFFIDHHKLLLLSVNGVSVYSFIEGWELYFAVQKGRIGYTTYYA